ncbi:MAG TPA: hypothetical protein VF403_25085 [Kofleriaceae bacterium]
MFELLALVHESWALRRRSLRILAEHADVTDEQYVSTGPTGSGAFVQSNRDPIDFMVCMDLVGHRFGSDLIVTHQAGEQRATARALVDVIDHRVALREWRTPDKRDDLRLGGAFHGHSIANRVRKHNEKPCDRSPACGS